MDPKTLHFKVISPPQLHTLDTVSKLKTLNGAWDVTLIKVALLSDDGHVILTVKKLHMDIRVDLAEALAIKLSLTLTKEFELEGIDQALIVERIGDVNKGLPASEPNQDVDIPVHHVAPLRVHALYVEDNETVHVGDSGQGAIGMSLQVDGEVPILGGSIRRGQWKRIAHKGMVFDTAPGTKLVLGKR
ncbi:hypothetical protein ACOSQ2_006895 [Xanthoceras sorbifolium]